MTHFIGEDWLALLQFNKLTSFDQLWELQADWFEEPNKRRGGWSGVSRIVLERPEGGKVGFFLKRQENHVCKSFLHPIKGTPTFAREFKRIQDFKRNAIPALEPVFFSEKSVNGHIRAILMTEELKDFTPFSDPHYALDGEFLACKKTRISLFTEIAKVMRKMHAHHFQHNCLSSKHLFVKQTPDSQWEVNIIDLEKTRWNPLKQKAIRKDLYTLNRDATNYSLTDRLRFLLIYTQEQKLSSQTKQLWRDIARRTNRKRSKKEDN